LFDRDPHPAQAISICSAPTIIFSPGWICTQCLRPTDNRSARAPRAMEALASMSLKKEERH
jgi:hypothetical protein